MTVLTKILFVLSLTTLVACNNALNKKYNESTVNEDLKEIVDKKEADTTEAKWIAMYIVRSKIINEPLDNKTYGDMLDKAKELRKAKADKKDQ